MKKLYALKQGTLCLLFILLTLVGFSQSSKNKTNKKPVVVFVTGDHEYGGESTLPIIAAELDQGISFKDTSTMTTIHRMECGWVYCVAWSVDGQYIAAGMESGEVIIINPLTRSIINKVKSRRGAVLTVSFNRTSDKLVSGSIDNTAIIYTVPDLTVLMTLKGHTDTIFCSLFLHDDRVVTGGEDHTIRVWGAEGNAIHIIKDHSNWVRSLAVSPDGKVLVSGGCDNKLCIYDSDTYKMTTSISCKNWVTSLC